MVIPKISRNFTVGARCRNACIKVIMRLTLHRSYNFFLQNNTFQACLITNGTKSYAVYTYQCGELQWSNEATIGFNAGGDIYENHPLSGQTHANSIACVHTNHNTPWNNVIYDLVPDGIASNGTTPAPPNSLGMLSS